jgi:hypothetical protein
MATTILSSIVPDQVADDCGEIKELNCGDVLTGNTVGEPSIVFPFFVGQTLPLSGGAIMKMDISSFGIEVSKIVNDIVREGLNKLIGLNLPYDDKLENLIKARNIVNKTFLELREVRLEPEGRRRKAPKLYLSLFEGKDGRLIPSVQNPDVNKICEFRFLPPSVLAFTMLRLASVSSEDGLSLGDVVGSSGKAFNELKDMILASNDLQDSSESDIIDLIVELLPIVNISENDIVKKRGQPVFGGFYTIFNGNIYLKVPDISGTDSASLDADIYTSNSNLYFEVLFENKFHRKKIQDFKAPIFATYREDAHDFPTTENLKLSISTSAFPGDIVSAHLSIIPGLTPERERGINQFSNNGELFSVPVLTRNDMFIDSRKPTVTINSKDFARVSEKIQRYYTDFSPLEFLDGDLGAPYVVNYISSSNLFGEMNRPQLILGNGDKVSSNKNNDRKYFRPQSYGAIKLLASNRARVYNSIPSRWISSISIDEDRESDDLVLTFRASDFANINIDGTILDGNARFALYLRDSIGQITRVAGFNVDLALEVPAEESDTEDLGVDGSVTGYAFNEFSASSFKGPITGLPVLTDGSNAKIKIRSKHKLFNGERDIFAYFGVKDTSENRLAMLKFEFPESISVINVEGVDGDILFSKNLQYEFKNSPAGADFYRVSDSRAILEFPGNKFSSYNLSGLVGIDDGYILFSENTLFDLVGENNILSLSSSDFSSVRIGSVEESGFINPPLIIGLAANNTTTLLENRQDDDIKNLFDGNPLAIDKITAFEKIPRLAIVFSGVDEPNLKNIYSFKIGQQEITPQATRKISYRGNNELLAVFNNVSIAEEGILRVTVEKDDKVFGFKSDSSSVSRRASIFILSEDLNFSEAVQGIVSSIDVTSDIESIPSGLMLPEAERTLGALPVLSRGSLLGVSPNSSRLLYQESGYIDASVFAGGSMSLENNAMEVLFPRGKDIGVPRIEPNVGFFDDIIFFGKIELSPNINIEYKVLNDDIFTYAGLTSDALSTLNRVALRIPTGSSITQFENDFVVDSNGNIISFLEVKVVNPATIEFNFPEVIGISTQKNARKFKSVDEDTIVLEAGKEVEVIVRNTKRNFVVKMKDVILRPKIRPEPLSAKLIVGTKEVAPAPGTYKATITIDESLQGLILNPTTKSCLDVCASTSNEERYSAKLVLGEDTVLNIDDVSCDIINGIAEFRIPNPQDLKDRIKKNPLRLGPVKLDSSMVPKDAINSFCDFSFALTADLKIALNSFQTLMVPVQTIFCIIDVICALLNPVKVAKAVIRLFECLYELVLLLPQISVPVMFLQLILHFLELIECVIEKILLTITTINVIIDTINREVSKKDKALAAIKSLEEALSEYLYEIETDLQFLEPVISVLAIFLELLQLSFRFPCQVTPGDGDPACGLDGTLLAGIVGGIVAPEGQILPAALVPVGQSYTEETIEEAAASSDGSEPLIGPVAGNIVGSQSANSTFLDSMDVDSNTLRATDSSLDFNVTFAPTITKSRKGFGNPAIVRFQFKERGKSKGFRDKIIDPEQTLDEPLSLLSVDSPNLEVSAGKGNFISPLDSNEFITITDDEGSVKPLELTFELPILEINETTGEVSQTGTEIITRTFDDIPSMAIMDEEFNLYFIEKDGIVFDSDNKVKSIQARMVNNVSAPKFRFSKEDEEIDTDDDEAPDDEVPVYDFPQIYFVDMRQAHEQIQQSCYNASINSFLLEEDNIEDIGDIVEDSQVCINTWLAELRGSLAEVRGSLELGRVPSKIDVAAFDESNQTLVDCLGGTVIDMCRFVVNTLNTSFKIIEDDDDTPLSAFPNTALTDDVLEGFESDTPALTGAREYAAGIGDSASIGVGDVATISLTPRDSYDEGIGGDFSDRIVFEIISDTSGEANFIINDNGSTVTKDGFDYTAKLTSSAEGEVRLRAKVCDRTIQAVTFDGVESELDAGVVNVVNCIPDSAAEAAGALPPLGALTKIDRILTVFFVKKVSISSSDEDAGIQANPSPQEFGSSLEN